MNDKDLFRVLTLGIIENKSIDLPEDLDKQTLDFIKSIPIKEIERAMTYAVKGMREYHLNVLPIHFLIHLSALSDKSYFYSSFNSIIRNPEDLFYFISYLKGGDIREGVGRAVRNQVNRWLLENINAEWTCQYRSKLNQISRTTHLRTEMRENKTGVSHETSEYLAHIQQNTGSFSRLEALNSVYQDLNLDKVTEQTLATIKEERILWMELMHHIRYIGEKTKMIIYGKALLNLTGYTSISDYVYLESLYRDVENMPEEIISHISEQLKTIQRSDVVPLFFIFPKLQHPEIRKLALSKMRLESPFDFYIDEKEWGRMPEGIKLLLSQGKDIHNKSKLEHSEKLLIVTTDDGKGYLRKEWGNGRDIILWQIEDAKYIESMPAVPFLSGMNLRTQYKLSGLMQGGRK